MTKKTAASTSFAKKFEELEEIAESFEHEPVDLEEGLKKFERGLALADELKHKLAEVEQRVETIKKKFAVGADEESVGGVEN